MRLMRGSYAIMPDHAFGVDIADDSISLVSCIQKTDGTIIIEDAVRTGIPVSAIVHGKIVNAAPVTAALRKLFAAAQIHPEGQAVITALPDSQVLLKSLRLDPNEQYSYEQLSAYAEQAAANLHTTRRSARIQWTLKHDDKTPQELFLYSANADLVSTWQKFFKKEGMRLCVVEMKSLALARSLIHKQPSAIDRVCIINFAYRGTTIAVFERSGITYSHIFEIGGEALTAAVIRAINVAEVAAEKQKMKFGLISSDHLDVADALKQDLKPLLTQIRKSLQEANIFPTKFILTGRGALIPGIRHFCMENLGVPTERGSLWLEKKGRKNIDLTKARLTQREQQLSAVAVGLALRGLEKTSMIRGINFISSHE